MHGFKSFAEPVVIEFHEGVTCVVGPNGSGKSNISDAIRWVLGEQSPKTLRGGKMEEVIFAGTANRKMRGMAEVNLVIDNSSGILNIDYSEVSITRRMFRSGDSEYLINNVPCRLKDIRNLIVDTGIGVDGYSIIGQGKIAEIVSNKPESRREIFEEAAGVVAYKTKKAEAERKLESTKANLERANDIIGEIEGRIDGLKEDSLKAKEYLQLKDEYESLEVNIILRNLEGIKDKNQLFQKDINDLGYQIRNSEEERRAASAVLENAQKDSNELELAANEAQNKLLGVIEQTNRLINRDKIKEEKLSSIEREFQRLINEQETLKERLSEEKANFSRLELEEAQVSDDYRIASDKLESVSENHQELIDKNSDLDKLLDGYREQLFSLHSEIGNKTSKLKSLETLRETLEKRRDEITSDWNQGKESSFEAKGNLTKWEGEFEIWSHKLELLLRDTAKYKEEIEDLRREEHKLNNEIRNLVVKEGQLSARKKTIEEMEANYEGYNYGVKFIMKSRATGIEGVVAELMKVPEGYETAIETALGASLQNVVCNDEQDAKHAIELLKANNAGRLTFLPLNRIQSSDYQVDDKIKMDSDYIGVGSQLINYDNKYKNIFGYLLGRVILVKTIEGAIKLSKNNKQGFRFVTLSGEVINPAGAISGGRYKNKSASLIERKSEIASLENEIRHIMAEVESSENTIKLIEKQIKDFIEKEKENAVELNEAQLKVKTLEERLVFLRKEVSDGEENHRRYEDQIRNIEEDIKDATLMIDEINGYIKTAKFDIESTELKSEDNLRALEESKTILSDVSEKVTELTLEKNSWESKLNHIKETKGTISKAIDRISNALSESENNLATLEKNRADVLDDGESEGTNLSILKASKEGLEDRIEDIKKQKNLLTEEIGRATKELAEANSKLSSIQEQKYQLEIKLAKNETQEETLTERLWEEFQMSLAEAMDKKSADFTMTSSVKRTREIRNRLRELGDVNVGSIKEYDEVSKRYDFLVEQRKDIVFASDELERIIKEMSETIKTKFKENFNQVVTNFESIFTELFGGGYAQLTMEDENNPLESGIEIVAQPPGKKLQNINLMSGGEKTMTAIALMFAVLKSKPTPFCILDEVEAALDDGNIDRFSKYLRKFQDIQFVLVTHQKATMEHADVLYGVTMAERGVSKVLSLKLGDELEL